PETSTAPQVLPAVLETDSVGVPGVKSTWPDALASTTASSPAKLAETGKTPDANGGDSTSNVATPFSVTTFVVSPLNVTLSVLPSRSWPPQLKVAVSVAPHVVPMPDTVSAVVSQR